MEDLSVWVVTPSRRFTAMRVKIFLSALEDELDTIIKSR